MTGQHRHLSEAEYGEMVERVHAAVTSRVPAGARVVVLSKGDAALVQIPGFAGAHFPQDAAGDYAGHHPGDSADAIAHLEELRRGGARYLVVPATATWWLEFYRDFAEHLASSGTLVADEPGTCRIFDLGGPPAAGHEIEAEGQTPSAIAQMRDYLENLLSTDSRAVVLETGGSLAARLSPLLLGGVRAEELLYAADGPLSTLRRLAAQGEEYLVVARDDDGWLQRHPDVRDALETGCRKLADQRHLCRVFDLRGLWAAA